jgi:hypothetical protein
MTMKANPDSKPKEKKGELSEIADAIKSASKWLGTNNAVTDMGAIEAHASILREVFNEKGTELAEALGGIATALDNVSAAGDNIAHQLGRIASALERGAKP